MSSRRAIAKVGGLVGLVSAGAAVAVSAQRRSIGRMRAAPDPHAEVTFGELTPDRTYTVTTDDGVGLAVQEVGEPDAPLVAIFVHGYTLAQGSWHYQRLGLADLTSPRVRLVFYDQRSHGRSDRAPSDSCEVEQLGRDLDAVLRAAADQRPVALIGHSMGGMAVMALADLRPELFGTQVRGVALLSTTTGGLAELDLGLPKVFSRLTLAAMPVFSRGLKARPRLAELTRRTGADLSWALTRQLGFGDRAVSPALVDYVGQMIADTPVEVVADFFATLMGNDSVQALPALRAVETLILCGDRDRLTPLAHSQAMKDELPDAELVVVGGAGHLAMMERPELVNLRLRAFLHRASKRWRRAGARRRA